METQSRYTAVSTGAVQTTNARLAATLGGAKKQGKRALTVTLSDGTTIKGDDVYFTVGKDGETVTLFPKRAGGWPKGEEFDLTVTL